MPRLVTRHPGNRDHAISWHISTFHTCPMQLHAMGNICNLNRKHVVVTQVNPYTTSHITNKIVTTQYRLIPWHTISFQVIFYLNSPSWNALIRILSCSALLCFKNPYISVYKSLHMPALDVYCNPARACKGWRCFVVSSAILIHDGICIHGVDGAL